MDTVAGVERGRSRPYRATLELMCDALALPAAEREAVVAVWRSAVRRSAQGVGEQRSVSRVTVSTSQRPTTPLTPLIGRDRETAQIDGLLAGHEVRLVTLVGPGGVGKTRLAQWVDHESSIPSRYVDGLVWVDLAPLRDPALVPAAIVGALGLGASGGLPALESLAAHLRDRRMLLILDNCEQVAASAPNLQALLSWCPLLAILATSRGALRIRGERLVPVGPLGLPAPDDLRSVARVAQAPAVSVFVARAEAAKPGFALSPANIAAVTAVCHRLDGLPLALELAAARLTLFSPEALFNRLQDGVPVLGHGPRDVPERQQTLQATIAWSYDLLTESEQALLRRLAVFTDGATYESIAAVCTGRSDSGPPDASPVVDDTLLDLLVALEAQSLFAGDSSGGRFRLLETVRDFVLTCSAEVERAELGDRHARHFFQLAEQAAVELAGPSRGRWLALLDEERGNLRSALAWLRQHGEPELHARLACALGWLWYFRGPLGEGRTELNLAAQALVGAAPPALRASLAWHGGRLAHLQGDERAARSLLQHSIEVWRVDASSTRGLAYALADLGQVTWFAGDLETGRQLATESVALFRDNGDRWGLGLALQDLAQAVISAGEFDVARLMYEEILDIYRDLDDRWGQGLPLLGLGRVALAEGDVAAARRLLDASRAIFDAVADRRMRVYVLMRQGQLERRVGNSDTAYRLYREAYSAWQELGNRAGCAGAIAGLAGVATSVGLHSAAALLAGASAKLIENVGRRLSPPDKAELDADLTRSRRELGEQGFLRWWTTGQQLTWPELDALVAEDRNDWADALASVGRPA